MASEGIARNIFNLIDSVYYLGENAVIAPNSDARGGQYAKVFGPNQKILDTGWSNDNVWIGLHQLWTRWFTDSEATNALVVEYWKKDPEGVETLSYSKELHFMNDISDEWGNNAGDVYFLENYQYKIICKSNHTVAESEYVAVDYVKIIVSNLFDVKAGRVYASPDPNVPSLQKEYAGFVNVTGNGTSYHYSATIDLSALDYINDIIYFYPVVTESSSNPDLYAKIVSIDYTTKILTVAVVHRAGSNWSGTSTVFYKVTIFDQAVSLD